MKEWEYHPPPDIDASIAETLGNFPREPRMSIYAIRSLAAMFLRCWMRFYHRIEIDGRENLPATGSYVLVCNHTSHLDALCLMCAVPLARIHRTFPAAAADYFFSSLPRSAISAILINALPFDRKMKGAESLSVCARLLENDGNVLIIFPEGTRTTTGELGRFRSGIGRLVASTDLAVLPCYLDGGFRAWPKGTLLPRPVKLRLRIGEPQSYEQFSKNAGGVQAVCQDLNDRVALLGRDSR